MAVIDNGLGFIPRHDLCDFPANLGPVFFHVFRLEAALDDSFDFFRFGPLKFDSRFQLYLVIRIFLKDP